MLSLTYFFLQQCVVFTTSALNKKVDSSALSSRGKGFFCVKTVISNA